MGEFSLPHIIIVLVIVLVFFGPSRLPGLGKSLGEAIRGFKSGIDGLGKDETKPPETNQTAQQSFPRPQQDDRSTIDATVNPVRDPVRDGRGRGDGSGDPKS